MSLLTDEISAELNSEKMPDLDAVLTSGNLVTLSLLTSC